MEIISGIYMIFNKVNHKRYIGSSKNILKRWKQHKYSLNNKRHHNRKLQYAWEKYGAENFEFLIIEKCKNNELLVYEQYWYDYYSAFDDKYSYNLSPIARAGTLPTKIKMDNGELNISNDIFDIILYYLVNTDISIPKISKITNIHKNTIYAIYYKDEYVDLTKNINFIKRSVGKLNKLTEDIINLIISDMLNGLYDSEIAKKYNISVSTVYELRNHESYNKYTKDIVFPKSQGRIIGKKNSKLVDQYDEYGNFIQTFPNARIAEKETGISYKLISSVCHGYKRIAKGYIWRLHGDSFEKYPTQKKDY